jgi:hypothetical protein
MGKATPPEKPPNNRSKTGVSTRGGKFAPGETGNPKGRPKDPTNKQQLRQLFRTNTAAYRDELESIVFNHRYKPDARIRAINTLLERGWGKATAKVEMSGPEGAPIPVADVRPVLTSGERRARHDELMAIARQRAGETPGAGGNEPGQSQ